MCCRPLNYDQLTSDPIPYRAGYLLTIQLVVTDASTALKMRASYYSLRRMNDNVIVAKGIVAGENPGTILLSVRNQAYTLVVSCHGYFTKTVNIPLEAISNRLVEVYLLPLSALGTIRLVLTGIRSQAASNLHVIPCRNTGVWTLNSETCVRAQAMLPTVVYSGCSKATQLNGAAVYLEQPQCFLQTAGNKCTQWQEGSGTSQNDPTFQTIAMVNTSLGDYDIHVRLGPPPIQLAVNVAFHSSKNGSSLVELFSPIVPADGGSWWWHVGNIKIRSSGVQFTSINALSSDPTFDGCRITSDSITRMLDSSQGASISASMGAGRSIVLNIPPGVWPLSVPSQVTVSLLSDPPKTIPLNVTSAGPMIFLDPSGISFLPPGVTLLLPVSAQLPATRLMYPRNPFGIVIAIHRLSKGLWIPLQSTIIADSQDNAVYVSAVTDSFSAYAVLVLPPFASEKTQLNESIPENSTTKVSDQSPFPLGAVIGGSIGGVCAVLLSAFFLFRHVFGSKEKRVKVPIPQEHMPCKPSEDYALNQIATEQKSRFRHSSTPFNPDEDEPVNSNLAVLTENEMQIVGNRESLDLYMKKHPVDLSRPPSLPPFAIAKLVQLGHLLPSR
jgi:hypothetical protein